MPPSIVIEDPNIKVGDAVYEVTSSSVTAVGMASTNGSATITTSTDVVLFAFVQARQASLRIVALRGAAGTSLELVTRGGSGTGDVAYVVTGGTDNHCAIRSTYSAHTRLGPVASLRPKRRMPLTLR